MAHNQRGPRPSRLTPLGEVRDARCAKRSFVSKRAAKDSIAADRHGKTFHAYLCSTCGYWHLTTQYRPPANEGSAHEVAGRPS